MSGLIQDGTFVEMSEDYIEGTPRICGSCSIDELKNAGENLRSKRRLVAQTYGNEGAATFATKTPTVQRFSQRLVLFIEAFFPGMAPYTRKPTETYIKSHIPQERDVYIRPPRELDLDLGQAFKVLKLLCGIPECGLHWYLTYLAHHLEVLQMQCARSDPFVLIRERDVLIDGLVLLQIDESLGLVTESFLRHEESGSKVFRSKSRVPITATPTNFNFLTICANNVTEILSSTRTEKVWKL